MSIVPRVHGFCKAMSMQRESVCYHDIQEIKSLIDNSSGNASIMYYTNTGFNNVLAQSCINCLCMAIDTTMEALMFLLIGKIRQVFPSESEDYTGHNIHQPHHNISHILFCCMYVAICVYQIMLMFIM